MEQAFAFFIFAVVAAATPGPSNVMLTATGAIVGVRKGLACLLGVAVGMGSMMFVVSIGLGALILQNPNLLRALNFIGGALLLWLAWKIASAPVGDNAVKQKPVGFVGAAAFQWVNPKAWLACASAAGTFLQPQGGSALEQATLFAALFIAATLPSGFPWLAFGALLSRVLRNPTAARAFNIAMGITLALSVTMILY